MRSTQALAMRWWTTYAHLDSLSRRGRGFQQPALTHHPPHGGVAEQPTDTSASSSMPLSAMAAAAKDMALAIVPALAEPSNVKTPSMAINADRGVQQAAPQTPLMPPTITTAASALMLVTTTTVAAGI